MLRCFLGRLRETAHPVTPLMGAIRLGHLEHMGFHALLQHGSRVQAASVHDGSDRPKPIGPAVLVGYLKLKTAVRVLPSLNVTVITRQRPL